jgi:hypothetical protein
VDIIYTRKKELHACQNPEPYRHDFLDPQIAPFIVSVLSHFYVPAGGGFLCDKASVYGNNIKGTPASSCKIYFGQRVTGTGFSQCTSVFPCSCHATNDLHSYSILLPSWWSCRYSEYVTDWTVRVSNPSREKGFFSPLQRP